MNGSTTVLAKSALSLDGAIELLKTALSKAWGQQTRGFLIEVLNEAEDLGLEARAQKGELKRLLEKAEHQLGIGVAEAAKRPILEADMAAYRTGLQAVAADFSFRIPDLETLDILRGQTFFWVQNAFNRTLQDEMTLALDEYFTQGRTRIELAARLEAFLTAKEPKMRGYFDLLADHNATRIGEIGHISGYERAGVEYAEIFAVLDDLTSPICRHLHGRVIPMTALSAQKNALLAAARNLDMEAAKKAQPMLSGASEATVLMEPKTSKIIAQGVGMPPYHFRCRTTTVAHFEPADYWEKARHWAIDGEIPKNEQPRLIDYSRNARWGDHLLTWDKTRGGDGRQHQASFVHFRNHAQDTGAASLEEYNRKLFSLVRRGGRDVFLVIENKEHPYPRLIFYDEKTQELAILNLKGQQIATYFTANGKKAAKQIQKNEVVIKLDDMRGIKKWINFVHI